MIGQYALKNCPNLSTLVWPESVTTVGYDVFEDCTKLQKLAGSKEQDDVVACLKSITPLMNLCITKFKVVVLKNRYLQETFK